MKHRMDDLTYLAGYLASGKAKVEMFNSIITVSIWVPMTNDDGEWVYWMLTTFGGGMVMRNNRYLVWTLAGPAAQELLKETLPIVEKRATKTADLISILAGAKE